MGCSPTRRSHHVRLDQPGRPSRWFPMSSRPPSSPFPMSVSVRLWHAMFDNKDERGVRPARQAAVGAHRVFQLVRVLRDLFALYTRNVRRHTSPFRQL